MTSNVGTLQEAVLQGSSSSIWAEAVAEWEVVGLDQHDGPAGTCICGQPDLFKLFSIENFVTGASLYPIGSQCIRTFYRLELDAKVKILEELANMKTALARGHQVELTTDYFSRSLLEWFDHQGVFTPDRWNYGEGWRDFEFLLSMFNKHQKNRITAAQQRKISAILNNKVLPYVRGYERIK